MGQRKGKLVGTRRMDLLVQFVIFVVSLTILSWQLSVLNPDRPYGSFMATSTMAIVAVRYYFAQSFDLSHETLREGWDDPLANTISVFAIAYMFADLPSLMILKIETYERVMFTVHHVVSIVSLFSAIYFNQYQRLMLFFLTAELTNILLNARKLLDKPPLLKLILDAMFAVSFLTYRMCYLFPILVRTISITFWTQEWFELFVINLGPLFIGFLHVWWTYLIIVGI